MRFARIKEQRSVGRRVGGLYLKYLAVIAGRDREAVGQDGDSLDSTLVTRENPLAVPTRCVPDAEGPVLRAGDDSAVGEDAESCDNTLVADHGHLEAAWRLQRAFQGF